MSELFDIPEHLSPRLQWLKRWGLTVVLNRMNGQYQCIFDEENCGWGKTAEEACLDFCVTTHWPHWNEL